MRSKAQRVRDDDHATPKHYTYSQTVRNSGIIVSAATNPISNLETGFSSNLGSGQSFMIAGFTSMTGLLASATTTRNEPVADYWHRYSHFEFPII
jgi:hypothetical protein